MTDNERIRLLKICKDMSDDQLAIQDYFNDNDMLFKSVDKIVDLLLDEMGVEDDPRLREMYHMEITDTMLGWNGRSAEQLYYLINTYPDNKEEASNCIFT